MDIKDITPENGDIYSNPTFFAVRHLLLSCENLDIKKVIKIVQAEELKSAGDDSRLYFRIAEKMGNSSLTRAYNALSREEYFAEKLSVLKEK